VSANTGASRVPSGSSLVIGGRTPVALSIAPHSGSAAGSGRRATRSPVPARLDLLGLDCVRVTTPVAVCVETPSAPLGCPGPFATAPAGDAALDPVRTKALVLVLSETLSSLSVLAWSLSLEPAPVEDIGSVSALAKAAPPADDEMEVLSVALWAIAPVPFLITVADRSPEELGRSCLVRTGEVVSARRALLHSRYPRV
jgi:hypothetical protein